LERLLDLRYELTPEEDALRPTISNVLKVLKIILYQAGVMGHRQQARDTAFRQEIQDQLDNVQKRNDAFLQGIKEAQGMIQFKIEDHLHRFSGLKEEQQLSHEALKLLMNTSTKQIQDRLEQHEKIQCF
jgi:hypothetical protein